MERTKKVSANLKKMETNKVLKIDKDFDFETLKSGINSLLNRIYDFENGGNE
jgi:hypothetical protein